MSTWIRLQIVFAKNLVANVDSKEGLDNTLESFRNQ